MTRPGAFVKAKFAGVTAVGKMAGTVAGIGTGTAATVATASTANSICNRFDLFTGDSDALFTFESLFKKIASRMAERGYNSASNSLKHLMNKLSVRLQEMNGEMLALRCLEF